MVIDFIITSNCDKAIETYLNTRMHSVADRNYQDMFEQLSREEQRSIVHQILIAQAEAINESIKACKTISLTGFGTFKYREGKRRAETFRTIIANSYGYDRFSDIDNDALRTKIINRVDAIKREVFVGEHIEDVKLGRSYSKAKVYTSFKRKKSI